MSSPGTRRTWQEYQSPVDNNDFFLFIFSFFSLKLVKSTIPIELQYQKKYIGLFYHIYLFTYLSEYLFVLFIYSILFIVVYCIMFSFYLFKNNPHSLSLVFNSKPKNYHSFIVLYCTTLCLFIYLLILYNSYLLSRLFNLCGPAT